MAIKLTDKLEAATGSKVIADAIQVAGGYMAITSEERNNLTDAQKVVGTLVFETNTGKTYRYTAEGWKEENKSDANHNHDDRYDLKGAAAAVKDELLHGAGDAYDTLKELGDLIDKNTNALKALQEVATNKADRVHDHNDIYYTETEIENKIHTLNTTISNSLNEAKLYTDNIVAQKTVVQIVTWEDED